MTEQPMILIVEDEEEVAEGYKLWLSGEYDVEIVADGQAALDRVDDDVDVMLLDRMMPKVSGAQVLEKVRERGIDCRIAMVSAVEPDFDVIAMGFDAYITKPPEREELLDTVEQLLKRAALGDEMQEYHSMMARRGALEAQKTEQELAESEQYQQLLDEIDTKREQVDEGLGDMSSEVDFVSAVRGIADEDESPTGNGTAVDTEEDE